eukprot:m.83602 g.83602  ORF g.83602 m.83602 type:complete len:340 (-) comp8695_c0_seq2:888-1907(-)
MEEHNKKVIRVEDSEDSSAIFMQRKDVVRGIDFGKWRIEICKSHMMESRCHNKCIDIGDDRDGSGEAGKSPNPSDKARELCEYCQFVSEFQFSLPEEVYCRNWVKITAKKDANVKDMGAGEEDPKKEAEIAPNALVFNAFESLKCTNRDGVESKLPQVSYAKEWLAAQAKYHRSEMEAIKPYDWTYESDFCGKLFGEWTVGMPDDNEGIDMEMLKRAEKILFQDTVFLLADDFGDNGIMHMNLRLRVMPSCFYILQRQFIRIDEVYVKLHDTRIFAPQEADYLIRDVSSFHLDLKYLEKKLGAQRSDGRSVNTMCTPENVMKLMPFFEKRSHKVEKLNL